MNNIGKIRLSVDFHSHILPCVDDGSASLEESLKLLTLSRDSGIESIVATPHFYPEQMKMDEFLKKREEAVRSLADFCFAAKGNGVVLPEVFLGAEVAYFNGISRSESVRRLCILGTGLILVEMPFEKWSDAVVDEMILMAEMPDVTPIIAHVERYIPYQKKAHIKRLLDSGLLIQCNGEAFFDPTAKRCAKKLMKGGNVHLLGSDCHDVLKRRPGLDVVSEYISERFGDDAIEAVNEREKELLKGAVKVI